MKKEFWNEMAKPFVVLVVICIVASGLLGFMHGMTEPVIEQNKIVKAEATRKEVLPQADSFVEVAVPDGASVNSIYKAANGTGYVIEASCYGYHGDVVVTIGFDADGKILALSANVKTETSGVGSKAGQPAYLDKYVGLSKDAESVSTISGATYSSAAVRTSISNAMAALALVK